MAKKTISKDEMIQQYKSVAEKIDSNLEYIQESESYLPKEHHTYEIIVSSNKEYKIILKYSQSNWRLKKELWDRIKDLLKRAENFLTKTNEILEKNLEML